MAKKCIGIREATGEPCKRPVSDGSDFCFAHKPQEGDARILNLQHDVYHCPDDGEKLWYLPKKGYHRCDTCGGVLMSEKEIGPAVLENILELPEAPDEGSVVGCPTCIPDSVLSEDEVSLSNVTVEWAFYVSKSQYHGVTYHGVSNVGHCGVCGSTWFSGPGEHDALGKKIGKDRRELWRHLDSRGDERFGEHSQSFFRDERVKQITAKEEKEEKQKEKQCKHVDSDGQRCNREKMQKKGAAYCYKHRPK